MTTWNAAPMPELGLELVRDVDRERIRSRLPRWDPRLWGDAQFSKNTRPGNRLLKLGLAWGRERVKARKLQQENATPAGEVAPVSRFTGKEEDVEVGLQYFGKRYLSPYLGRWISADPLAVHSPGSADLNLYAYVSGTVLKAIDPLGLNAESGTWTEHAGATGQASYMQDTDTVNADVVVEDADIIGMTIRGPGTANGHVEGETYNVPGPSQPETTEGVLRLPQHEGLRQLVGGSPEMGGALRLHNQFATAMSETAEVGADVGMVMFDVATLGASPTGDIVMAKRLAQMERMKLTVPELRFSGGRMLQGHQFEEAEAAYDVIRASDDVASISANTGMRQSWVARVKDHVFTRTHELDSGVRRFDADPYMANAWRRMAEGTHTPNDMNLLRHELFESRFEGIFGTTYRTSHDAAIRAGRTWDPVP